MAKSSASDLLATPKARLVLAAYGQPLAPSEVARRLQMPANTVHYWTRRLAGAGLLEQVGQEGRVRTYRSLVDEEACEPEACVPFVSNMMQALDKVVMAAAERHDLAEPRDRGLLPEIGLHELRLRPEDVARVKEALQAAMPTSEDHAPDTGETYTVSFIVTPGGISEFF